MEELEHSSSCSTRVIEEEFTDLMNRENFVIKENSADSSVSLGQPLKDKQKVILYGNSFCRKGSRGRERPIRVGVPPAGLCRVNWATHGRPPGWLTDRPKVRPRDWEGPIPAGAIGAIPGLGLRSRTCMARRSLRATRVSPALSPDSITRAHPRNARVPPAQCL